MEINFYTVKNQPTFNAQYPYRDIMCIMSSSEIVGRKSDTFEKTIAGILNKKPGIALEEKVKDYLHARDYLQEKYPQFQEAANSFRKMIDRVNRNHYAITDTDIRYIFSQVENSKKFIEII
jgi:hypothetical protein